MFFLQLTIIYKKSVIARVLYIWRGYFSSHAQKRNLISITTENSDDLSGNTPIAWSCKTRTLPLAQSLSSEQVLTLFMVLAFCLANTCSIASIGIEYFSVSGCWRYFFSLRISVAFLAFSTSNDWIGNQPTPLNQLLKSALYTFF